VKVDDASCYGPFFKKSFEIFAFDAFLNLQVCNDGPNGN
jgi:hypothetical protein